jgi:endogenous inhibitor of DNA gyrase (YacG/DUF329 family)
VSKAERDPKASGSAPLKKGRCPRCGKPFQYETVAKHKPFPFCSQRCRDVDLGLWLTGGYSIPGKPIPPEAPTEDADDAT